MAWYNDGNWGGLPISYGGRLLAELCTAINERETYVGLTQTTWPIIAGAPVEPAQFTGLRIAALATASTLTRMRTAIEALVAPSIPAAIRYVKESDGSDWTAAELITAAGFGDSWVAFSRISDIVPWLQIKACLDLLRWKKIVPTLNLVGQITGYADDYDPGQPHPTGYQATYEKAQSVLAPGGGGDYLESIGAKRWTVPPLPRVLITVVRLRTSATWEITAYPVHPGSVRNGWIYVREQLAPNALQLFVGHGAMDYELDGESFTAAADTDNIRSIAKPAVFFQQSLPITIPFTLTLPEAHPYRDTDPDDETISECVISIDTVVVLIELIPGTDLTYG